VECTGNQHATILKTSESLVENKCKLLKLLEMKTDMEVRRMELNEKQFAADEVHNAQDLLFRQQEFEYCKEMEAKRIELEEKQLQEECKIRKQELKHQQVTKE